MRASIHAGLKVILHYRDQEERETLRTVWPFVIGYRETTRAWSWPGARRGPTTAVSAPTAIAAAEFLEERYPSRPALLRARWYALMREQRYRPDQ